MSPPLYAESSQGAMKSFSDDLNDGQCIAGIKVVNPLVV
jgi:hypothetical protein